MTPVALGIIASGRRAAGYGGLILADSPQAYYRMGGATSGATMMDSSGAGRHGTYATPSSSVAGLIADPDAALSGTATVPVGTWLNGLGSLSAEAWVQTTSTGVTPIVGRSNGQAFGSPDNHCWRLWASGGAVYWQIFNASGNIGVSISGGSIANGQPHHVMGSWSSTTARLLVDGIQVATATPTAFTRATSSTLSMGLGRMVDLFVATALVLDEVAVYGADLSGRALAHYNAGRPS